MASFMLSHFFYVLFPRLLSRGSVDVPALLAEVTQVWEIAIAAEATRATVILATEASAQETVVAWDSTNLRVKDAEDWAALAEREALERVSRVAAENATTLASTHEDVEGLTQKIVVLEDELVAERRAQEVSERERW
jgi:hypothetical protein